MIVIDREGVLRTRAEGAHPEASFGVDAAAVVVAVAAAGDVEFAVAACAIVLAPSLALSLAPVLALALSLTRALTLAPPWHSSDWSCYVPVVA